MLLFTSYGQCLENLPSLIPQGTLDLGSDYGRSMSLNGDYLAIAETTNDSLASNSGIIYIYKIQGDFSWKKIATLAASDPSENFYLGYLLAIHDNTIVAGGNGLGNNKVYLFTKSEAEEWSNRTESSIVEVKEIIDGKRFVASSLSVSNNHLAVGYEYDSKFSDDYELQTNIYDLSNNQLISSIPTLTTANSFREPGKIAFGSDFVAIAHPYYSGIPNLLGTVTIHDFDPINGFSETPNATLTPMATSQIHFGIDLAINNDIVFVANSYEQDNDQFKSQVFGFNKPITGWADSNESFILETGKTNSNHNEARIAVNENYLVHNKWFEGDLSIFKKSMTWTNQSPETTFSLPAGESHENPLLGTQHLIMNKRSNPQAISYFVSAGDFENIATSNILEDPTFSATNFDFGKSISIDTNRMVVGAPRDGVGGAIYYYTKVDEAWVFHSKIESPFQTSTYFGYAVELSDSLLFVSQPFADSLNIDDSYFLSSAGRVLQYELTESGWEYRNTMTSPDLNEGDLNLKRHFGKAISYQNGYVAVGRYYTGSSETDGRVFIYQSVNNSWSHVATLQPETDTRGDFFGTRVLLQDSVIFIASSNTDGSRTVGNDGGVFVYTKKSDHWENATEDARLLPSDKASFDQFGFDISVNGSTIAVGAPNANQSGMFDRAGQAYIFEKPQNGWVGDINEKYILKPKTRIENSEFGNSVFISNTEILVGGRFDSNGSIFRFSRALESDGGAINELEIISSPNPTEGGEFGSSIVGTNVDILTSALKNDTEEGFSSGEVFSHISNNTFSLDTAINCDSYTWFDSTYVESGNFIYVLPNSGGCDSLLYLNLTILHSNEGAQEIEACESYLWEGITFTESGLFSANLTNIVGCDSIATLDLTILKNTEGSQDLEACDSYEWGGMTLTESGSFSANLTNAAGCDSLAILNLTILDSTEGSQHIEICDSYTWEGATFTDSGSFTELLTNAVGCDSVATLHLTILKSTEGFKDVEICNSYEWEGMTLTESGSYFNTLTNSIGCDSVATLNLQILSSVGSQTLEICEFYEWEGMTLTDSGVFSSTLTNQAGCDSVATLNLTILQGTEGSQEINACDSYEWEGMTLIESGVFSTTLTNQDGCDSLATLGLTILATTEGSLETNACDSYEWEGMTLTESGIFSTILTNQAGCDSLATLDLTILATTEGSLETNACESYEWEGMTLTESGIFSTILTNQAGCDSLATLDLTILATTEGSLEVNTCESYEWEGMTLTESGVFSTTLSNLAGCDSLATLDLTILATTEGSLEVNTCDSYEWEGMTLTESGVFSTTLTNQAGCDSLATLNLEITKSLDIQLIFSDNVIEYVQGNAENIEQYQFQWYDCSNGLPIVRENSKDFEIQESGEYYLRITDGACISESQCTRVELVLGSFDERFQLYPNPLDQQLNLQIPHSKKDVHIEVISVTGAIVKSLAISQSTGLTINMTNLKSGIYTVLIKQGDEIVLREKILKR